MVKCKVIKSFLRGKMDIHYSIPKWMLFYGGVIVTAYLVWIYAILNRYNLKME